MSRPTTEETRTLRITRAARTEVVLIAIAPSSPSVDRKDVYMMKNIRTCCDEESSGEGGLIYLTFLSTGFKII